MKRKLLITVLCMILFVTSGCGADVNAPADTDANTEVRTETGIDAATETGADSAEQNKAPKDTGTDEEMAEEPETTGGYPWIDSNLKSNIKADAVLSPRDDFHLYKNHDWLLANDIAEGEYTYGSSLVVGENVLKKALLLLEDDSIQSHDAELVHSFNDALLNWDARNKAGLEPVKKTVQDIQNIHSLEELSDFICDPERSLFVPVFLAFENKVSLDDAHRYITWIDTGSLTLKDAAEYANRTEMGELHFEANHYLAKAMLTRLGYSEEEADQMFSDAIDFEGKLAEKRMTSAEELSPDRFERINNVYAHEELSTLTRSYPLTRLLKARQYDNGKEYLVPEPEAVKRIDELYTEDHLDAIRAYMMIGYLNGTAFFLDKESFDAFQKRGNILYGTTGIREDETIALNIIKEYLPTPLDRFYLEKYDAAETKKRITKLCKETVDVYRKMLSEEDWLSEETKNKAIEKLDALKIQAVYPDKWEDYSGLELKELSLYDQITEIARFEKALDRGHTNGMVDPEIWEFEPELFVDILECNAFYDEQKNTMYIVLGILNEPYYYDGISEEALLGCIGFPIGHEISHAFDTGGAQYDKDGSLKSWWTKEDHKAFQDRADKLIQYYNGMTAWKGRKILGENIQREAIADMAGMKAMLKLAEEKEDFDYDEFFTAFASFFCFLDTPELDVYCVTQDEHPLFYLRTNSTIQQFDEFYETYDVKEGDNMYLAPEDRVLVW